MDDYKELVLKVYPQAKIYPSSKTRWIATARTSWIETARTDIITDYVVHCPNFRTLSAYHSTEKAAWEEAWKNIQEYVATTLSGV